MDAGRQCERCNTGKMAHHVNVTLLAGALISSVYVTKTAETNEIPRLL